NAHGGRLEHSWWGILGLIGWAYFAATTLYLLLRREHLSALVAASALLMCMYFADHAGAFKRFVIPLGSWTIHPASIVNFGEALGSHASITMAGVVLGAMLLPTSMLRSAWERVRLAGVLAVITALAAVLLEKTYGISKNAATPS